MKARSRNRGSLGMMSEGRRIDVQPALKRGGGVALKSWIVCVTLALAAVSAAALERSASAEESEDFARRHEAYADYGAHEEPAILIIDESEHEYPRPARRQIGLLSQLQLGLPFMLSEASMRRDPGANLAARFAMSSPYFGAGFQGGYQWIPGDERGGRSRATLGRAFFGPFVHVQIPTRSFLTPYLQSGADFNYWNRSELERYCDRFQCFNTRVYRFTPGLHGRLGATFAFNARGSVALDLGLEANLIFRGNYFDSHEWFLMPYLGLAIRN